MELLPPHARRMVVPDAAKSDIIVYTPDEQQGGRPVFYTLLA